MQKYSRQFLLEFEKNSEPPSSKFIPAVKSIIENLDRKSRNIQQMNISKYKNIQKPASSSLGKALDAKPWKRDNYRGVYMTASVRGQRSGRGRGNLRRSSFRGKPYRYSFKRNISRGPQKIRDLSQQLMNRSTRRGKNKDFIPKMTRRTSKPGWERHWKPLAVHDNTSHLHDTRDAGLSDISDDEHGDWKIVDEVRAHSPEHRRYADAECKIDQENKLFLEGASSKGKSRKRQNISSHRGRETEHCHKKQKQSDSPAYHKRQAIQKNNQIETGNQDTIEKEMIANKIGERLRQIKKSSLRGNGRAVLIEDGQRVSRNDKGRAMRVPDLMTNNIDTQFTNFPIHYEERKRNRNIHVSKRCIENYEPDLIQEIIMRIVKVIMDSDRKAMTFNGIRTALDNKENISFEDMEDLVYLVKRRNQENFIICREHDESRVTPKANIKICTHHTRDNGQNGCTGCSDLHICKFFLVGKCSSICCKFGHEFFTEHNRRVLRNHCLEYLIESDIQFIARQIHSRNDTTVPIVCRFYNNIGGCKEGTHCGFLHICKHFVTKDCKFTSSCKRSHNLNDIQPKEILEKYGLSSGEYSTSTICEILHEMERRGICTKQRSPEPFLKADKLNLATASAEHMYLPPATVTRGSSSTPFTQNRNLPLPGSTSFFVPAFISHIPPPPLIPLPSAVPPAVVPPPIAQKLGNKKMNRTLRYFEQDDGQVKKHQDEPKLFSAYENRIEAIDNGESDQVYVNKGETMISEATEYTDLPIKTNDNVVCDDIGKAEDCQANSIVDMVVIVETEPQNDVQAEDQVMANDNDLSLRTNNGGIVDHFMNRKTCNGQSNVSKSKLTAEHTNDESSCGRASLPMWIPLSKHLTHSGDNERKCKESESEFYICSTDTRCETPKNKIDNEDISGNVHTARHITIQSDNVLIDMETMKTEEDCKMSEVAECNEAYTNVPIQSDDTENSKTMTTQITKAIADDVATEERPQAAFAKVPPKGIDTSPPTVAEDSPAMEKSMYSSYNKSSIDEQEMKLNDEGLVSGKHGKTSVVSQMITEKDITAGVENEDDTLCINTQEKDQLSENKQSETDNTVAETDANVENKYRYVINESNNQQVRSSSTEVDVNVVTSECLTATIASNGTVLQGYPSPTTLQRRFEEHTETGIDGKASSQSECGTTNDQMDLHVRLVDSKPVYRRNGEDWIQVTMENKPTLQALFDDFLSKVPK